MTDVPARLREHAEGLRTNAAAFRKTWGRLAKDVLPEEREAVLLDLLADAMEAGDDLNWSCDDSAASDVWSAVRARIEAL